MTKPDGAGAGGLRYPFGGVWPKVHPEAFVAPNAVLVGDVVIGAGASVWFGAVLRGDYAPIDVAAGANVQDNAVVHTGPDAPVLIGERATVAHGAVVHSATIRAGALVGNNAVVLDGASVGEGSLVAASSVVTAGTAIPASVLAAGTPATVRGPLREAGSKLWVEAAAAAYVDLAARYRSTT